MIEPMPRPVFLSVIILASALGLTGCGERRQNVLVPAGEAEIVVMDFSAPLPLDPLPAGWHHRKFWTRAPMTIGFAVKDGVPAIRLATDGTASMLFRHVDIDLAAYPRLAWRWHVEKPIDSPLDERTRAGDDHPARLFIAFRTASGEDRRMEIIWGNKVLKAGDIKYLGTFPHYVANGGDANIGRWIAEDVDLGAIYRRFWPDAAPAHVIDIALFCDSDETRAGSVAYFADVRMKR
jgi:hypothetical protein